MDRIVAITPTLDMVSIVSWAVVYLLAIRRGFLDRTYPIPFAAVIANVSWEVLYAIVLPEKAPVGTWVPVLWLAFDVPILLLTLYYSGRELPAISRGTFAIVFILGLATSLSILYFAETENRYIASAYPQNLMMSILFIGLVCTRENARGQSMYIGLFKLVGTAAPGLSSLRPEGYHGLSGLYTATVAAIFAFDLLYLVLLYRKLRGLGIRPWRRL